MTGSGMHQHINYNIKFQIKKHHLNNDLHNNQKCKIIIVDFVEHTSYFDFDELKQVNKGNITLQRIMDIEKPSSLAPQEKFMLSIDEVFAYNSLEEVEALAQFEIMMKLPYHFRYRDPH